jgi:hypothetical protein
MNRGLFALAVPWGQEKHEAGTLTDRDLIQPPTAFLQV